MTGLGKERGENTTSINTLTTKRSIIQVRKRQQTEEAENMTVSERSISDINRFIYASSVQQPNADLLGSDSEYSAI